MNASVVRGNIRALRIRRGWTQSELGRRVTVAGLRGASGGAWTQPMISFLEIGETYAITDDVIEAMCVVFGIPAYMLEATSTSVTEVAEVADQLAGLAARLSAATTTSPADLLSR